MARRLFIFAGIAGVLAFAAGLAGIWISDPRWADTACALWAAFGLVGVVGIFAAIWEY